MQVLYLGRAPLYEGDSARFSEVASGNPTSTCIPRVDGLSTNPRVLGRHNSVSGQMYFRLCMARLWDIMTNYIVWSAIGG